MYTYIFTPFDCCKLNICIPTFSWQTKTKLGSGLPYFDQLWWCLWSVSFSTTTPEVLMAGSPEIFSPFIKGDSELGRVSSIPSERCYFFQFLSIKISRLPLNKVNFWCCLGRFWPDFSLDFWSDVLLEKRGPPPNNSHPWYRFENNHPSKWLVKWVSSPSYKWGMLGLEPIY